MDYGRRKYSSGWNLLSVVLCVLFLMQFDVSHGQLAQNLNRLNGRSDVSESSFEVGFSCVVLHL